MPLPLYGKYEIIQKLCNAFNSYSNAFITGDIFLRNGIPFPPILVPALTDSHYALSTKLNFQPEPFKCLKC